MNLWRNIVQKRARRHRIAPSESLQEGIHENVNRFFDDIVINFEHKTMCNALLNIINSLDDRFRIPLLLYYANEMKIKEIASILSKPEGTVKRLLHEAKMKLKKEMEDLGYDGSGY